jgi:hypothetical protein
MAGDLASTMSSAAQDAGTLARNLEAAANSAQGIVSSLGGSNITGSPGNTVVANHTTSSSQTANNSNGGSSNSGYKAAFPTNPASTSTAPSAEINMHAKGGLGKYFVGALAAAETVGAFLPTVQETVTAQSLAERIRFFSNDANSGNGRYGNFMSGPQGTQKNTAAYDMMRKFSAHGSATSPLDAANAINAGMGAGLLPNLPNYSVGTKPGVGVLGGAALASNLVGGIGLTGGMQAMATLNQASSVNMLKMVGIDVRNSKGTGMNDLPSIINKVYQMLKQANDGKNPTAQDIAISMQSGNALDSFLNQYFGGDSALKDVVLSGVMQQAQSAGQSLYESGDKRKLQQSGAITGAITSAGFRNSAELQMIQQFAKMTTKTSEKMNTALTTMYGLLGNNAQNPVLSTIAAVNTGVGQFAAARGGGGAVAINNMLDLAEYTKDSTAMDKFLKPFTTGEGKDKKLNTKGKWGAELLMGGVGASAWYATDQMQHSESNLGMAPWDPGMSGAPVANKSQQGPVFTGDITVQVTAPPGTNAAEFGDAIAATLSGSTRRT